MSQSVDVVTGRGLPDPQKLMEDILSHRGWDIRSGQEEMVHATAEGIASESRVAGISVNAPVGTGKTLGYLIGSLPSDRRILVCTSTRPLQDQIAKDELPLLAKDIKELYDYDLTYAVLKGKGNYICLKKAEDFIGGRPGEDDDPIFEEIAKSLEDEHRKIIKRMIEQTKDAMERLDATSLDVGDLLAQLPSDVRGSISSSTGCTFCRGRWWYETDDYDEVPEKARNLDLPFEDRYPTALEEIIELSECAYRTAYALALKADIAVINTSLLAAEMMKSRMVWELTPQLIPGAGVIVIDEGHKLTGIVTESLSGNLDFGESVSESKKVIKKIVNRVPSWEEDLALIPTIIDQAKVKFMRSLDLGSQKERREEMVSILREASGQIIQIKNSLNRGRIQPEDVKFVDKHLNILDEVSIDPMVIASGQASEISTFTDKFGDEIKDVTYDITLSGDLDEDDEFIESGGLQVSLVPIDISFFFSELTNKALDRNVYTEVSETSNVYDGKTAVLICSGTITEEDTVRIGMKRDFHLTVSSPFDPLRVRFCTPGNLPAPTHGAREEWYRAAWESATQAIEAVGGRTLFLTTSFAAIYGDDYNDGFLQMARDTFGDRYQILHQNNGMSRAELVQAKKDDPTSILFATTSFWEGIDIPGEALMLTIMDKLMFPQVDDGSIEAARSYFERKGESPFMKVDVNHVAKMLAQGEGRTQRKESDLGGTLLLDSRQVSARYGEQATMLVNGRTPYTTNLDAFCEWLEWCSENIGAEDVPMPDPENWKGLRRNLSPVRRRRRKA